jgi:hypothetical protein
VRLWNLNPSKAHLAKFIPSQGSTMIAPVASKSLTLRVTTVARECRRGNQSIDFITPIGNMQMGATIAWPAHPRCSASTRTSVSRSRKWQFHIVLKRDAPIRNKAILYARSPIGHLNKYCGLLPVLCAIDLGAPTETGERQPKKRIRRG